jgi:hypothetical protein
MMPWVRFDDQFPIHRKVDGLTDAAYRLHTSAIFWSARNLTDGFVSREDLGGVTARVRTPSRFAAECVSRGAWHDSREPCTSEKCPAPVDSSYPQGWVIHDYWEYQPSARKVKEGRIAKAERQRRWLQRKQNRKPVDNDASADASQDASKDGAPYPPRPEGSGAAYAPPSSAAGPARPPGQPSAQKPRPPWCGECEERTRMVNPDAPRRCPNCHPLIEAL